MSALAVGAGTGGLVNLNTTVALTPKDAMGAFKSAKKIRQSFHAAGGK